MNDQPSKYPGHTFLVQSAVLQSHSHSCIMWALGFLLRFLAMQPVAKVDSKGEQQGFACVILDLPNTIYPLMVGQVWEEMYGQGNNLSWLAWPHS